MKHHNFSRVVGITLSFVLVGLLSLTAYAAGSGPEGVYQAVPAANHCAGISNDAAGSTLLAANPELAAACRFASMVLEQQEAAEAAFPNIAGPEPEAAGSSDSAFFAANPEVMRARRYTTTGSGAETPDSTPAGTDIEEMRLHRYITAESEAEMPDSTFAAANPEVMTARHYTTTGSDAGLQQKLDTIQRFGLAEHLATQKDAEVQPANEVRAFQHPQFYGQFGADQTVQPANEGRVFEHGLAEELAAQKDARLAQRTKEAETARYVFGLAPANAEESVLERAQQAEAARYTGLAESYAEDSALQRARAAEAARYAGLARMYEMQERVVLTGQE